MNNLSARNLRVGQALWLPGVVAMRDEQHDYIDLAPSPTVSNSPPGNWSSDPAGAPSPCDQTTIRWPAIRKITIHHTAIDTSDNLTDIDFLRLVQNRHHRLGWADIGYHYIIGHDGRIYRGRPERVQGAHVGGERNRFNLGIAIRGNFMKRMPKPSRWRP